jgi:hypothetical protein
MRWEPITPDNVVVRLSVASQHAISDFKATYDVAADPTKSFEIAKDVCAFTNHLGGSIIVGAHEGTGARKGMIGKFEELKKPNPGELVKAIERAVRLYCAPLPSVNAIIIPLEVAQVEKILGRSGEPATTIVAINVDPGLNTPYGCRACSDECKECKTASQPCSCKGKEIGDAYRFPIRVIEGARFLRPEELGKFMNVAERRAMLDLLRLADEPKITVWFNPGNATRGVSRPCKIVNLDMSLMACTLELLYTRDKDEPNPYRADIPLLFVRATWRSQEGWNVAVDGIAFEMDGRAKRLGFYPPGGIS